MRAMLIAVLVAAGLAHQSAGAQPPGGSRPLSFSQLMPAPQPTLPPALWFSRSPVSPLARPEPQFFRVSPYYAPLGGGNHMAGGVTRDGGFLNIWGGPSGGGVLIGGPIGPRK